MQIFLWNEACCNLIWNAVDYTMSLKNNAHASTKRVQRTSWQTYNKKLIFSDTIPQPALALQFQCVSSTWRIAHSSSFALTNKMAAAGPLPHSGEATFYDDVINKMPGIFWAFCIKSASNGHPHILFLFHHRNHVSGENSLKRKNECTVKIAPKNCYFRKSFVKIANLRLWICITWNW